MKKFYKTVLACALAAGSAVTLADTVEILDGQGDVLVTYSADAITVQSGTITVSNGVYQGGTIPGAGGAGVTCDPLTTTIENGVCVGSGGGLSCGLGTEPDATDSECVPATPPTLSISSSPTSMGDGVSSATLTFQFSRPVTGFNANDISVSPSSHTLTGFSAVDSDTFRATINRSGNASGTINVSVSSGSYQGTNGASGGGGSRSITLVGGSTNVGNCEVPANVTLSNISALSSFGMATALIEFDIPRSEVLSRAFTTTGGSANGQINLGGDSGTSEDMRNMWISECPGGEPVSNRCERPGNLTTMRWIQGSSRVACSLDKNATYYFNISSDSCSRSSGCRAIIQHLGGW
ncbi:Ig-like domain-containing protein [Gilvimarinus chinensis]|uniref:Ig-like domain-containing protein n=1 Tax=Gilvimarinus chinensis TaxID=396005 RepID=UPI000368B628|nr:Ig-like domain-containing protein [Gilvimarinus chinensis]